MKGKITSITLRTVLTTVCAIILCAVLAVFVIGVPKKASSAEETVSVWDGNLVYAGWADMEGEGKTAAPAGYKLNETAKTLEIGSAAALAYFSHEVYIDSDHALDGYTVTLTTDIDLANKIWVPIGSTNRKNVANYRFSGEFNGNGHKIYNFDGTKYYSNITYTAEDGYYVDVNGIKIPFENDGGEFAYGLFGDTLNMTVKNLTVSGVNFDFSEVKAVNGKTLVPDNVGAIIGHNEGWLNVEECVAGQDGDHSVIKIKTAGNPAVGGLVGRAYANKQAGSKTTTTLESVNVLKSTNYIDIEYEAVASSGTQYGKVSGILGYSTSFKDLKFEKCVNYGKLTGGQFVGGIFAFFSDNSKNNKYENGDERKANAWNLSFDECVNYGELTSSNLDIAEGFAEGKTYVGGITGHLSPSTENYSSIISTNANYNKLAPVNFYIKNCRNYGTIRAYNTEATNGTTAPAGKGWNAAAGIIGSLTASETGKNVLTNNYNYGKVESIAKEGSTYYTPRMGGYIGWLYYYWGAEAKDHPNYKHPSERPIDLTITGGSSGKVIGENRVAAEGNIHVGSLIGSDYTYPNKPCDITLVATDGSKVYRAKDKPGEQEPVTATIDASKAEIGFGEYFGQANLTKVKFAENSTLTTIGEWAFAGTGLTQVELPESVTEIGTAAFGSDVYVIVKDKAHYDALKNSEKVSDDIKALLTYIVTVEYYDLSTGAAVKVGEEQRLCGQPYTVVCNSSTNLWADNANITYVGSSELGGGATSWYGSSACTDVLSLQTVKELLSGDEDTVKLYTRTVGSGDKFIALDNIVYGNTYELGAINALLAGNSKRVTNETVTITEFNGSTDNLPKVIRDAGTYTVMIGEQEVEIVIKPAGVELSAAGALQWRVNGNALTDGPVYLAGDVPTLTQPADGEYTVQAALESLVRARGTELTLALSGNGFTANVKEGSSASGTEVGKYTTVYTLTADDNYELKLSSAIVNAARGLTVTLDGDVATVTKVWYIVEMGNWLVDANGNDYDIADRVYGSIGYDVPHLHHGDSQQNRNKISYTLTRSGSEGVTFGSADFVKYLNNTLPVGRYTLSISAPEAEYYEQFDDEGNPEGEPIKCAAFTQEITFEITAATLTSDQGIGEKLNGATFGYIFGESGPNSANAATITAINSALENIYRSLPSNNMTVWDVTERPVIEVNLASDKTNVYSAFTLPGAVGVYTYNYRIRVENYNVIDRDEEGAALSFTLVAYGVVDLPVIAAQQYNGNAQTAIVTVSDQYRVLKNDGGVDAGTYDVVLELLNPECYIWADHTLAEHSSSVTAQFVIEQTTNSWTRLPNVVNWGFESFDAEINRIRAVPRYIGANSELYFKVATDEDGKNVIEGLDHISVDSYGRVTDAAVIGLLNGLTAGDYYLVAVVDETANYFELAQTTGFKVNKAFNSWADGKDDLVLPGWIVGKYSEKDNPIVVNPAHGVANIIVTDIDGNEYYNSASGVNKLNDCKAGKYLLTAWVDESADFAKLDKRSFTIEVFEKTGLSWWAVLLIVIAALCVAALVLFILWKKGVFQILTEKVVVAIRTRASIDATIASVRAAKKEEEVKKLRAAAEAKERAAARKAAAQAEKNLPAEERAAALEAKAQAQTERAEKMRLRAEAMQARAARMREQAQTTPETPAEPPAAETPEAQPATEAAATGPETPETPTEE